jgi:hypothetical protein
MKYLIYCTDAACWLKGGRPSDTIENATRYDRCEELKNAIEICDIVMSEDEALIFITMDS